MGGKKKPREDVIIEPKKNTAKEKNIVFVFIILAHFTAQMRETYILRISFHKVCSLAQMRHVSEAGRVHLGTGPAGQFCTTGGENARADYLFKANNKSKK